MALSFEPTEIPDVVLVRSERHDDARGSFREVFRAQEFEDAGLPSVFVQDNLARSVRGVLRGLHYQLPPEAQGKVVGVVRGEIWDVAVDLRVGARTFGHWVGRMLSADSGDMLWIPPGFAHGYCILSDVADVHYKVTRPYVQALNRGVAWDDPELGIRWPVEAPVLSDNDRSQPTLAEAENLFRHVP